MSQRYTLFALTICTLIGILPFMRCQLQQENIPKTEEQIAQHQQQTKGRPQPVISFEAPPQGQLSQQRQIAQVGQLILNGAQQIAQSSHFGAQAVNITLTGTRYANNMFEALKEVGGKIQQQVIAAANSIQGQPTLANHTSSNAIDSQYQMIGGSSNQFQNPSSSSDQMRSNPGISVGGSAVQNTSSLTNSNPFIEQGQLIRQEIISRANQLQQIVGSSLGSLRNNSDLIVRRLLEQMNTRLDQARIKADRIISEPTNNEVAVKALATINNGLTNLNNIVTNLVSRIDMSNVAYATNGSTPTGSFQDSFGGGPIISQRIAGPTQNTVESRFHKNLIQIKQQFLSSINAAKNQPSKPQA